MKSLTIFQKTRCPLDSFHCSQQKYFKIQQKTLQKIGTKHHSLSTEFIERSRQKIIFKEFIHLPTTTTVTQKAKIVDETISNNFQKIMKIKNIIPKTTKLTVVNNKIQNKITEMNNSYSQKKIKRLIIKPSLEKQFQGPSFWSYDPKPDYIKRKIVKELTFSRQVNEINLQKKSSIQESIKKQTTFKFNGKSQTNSTQNSFHQKEKPKLKRRAPFTYFSNRQSKENLQKEGKNQSKDKERSEQLISRTKITRTPSGTQSTASTYERYRRQTAIQTPFIAGEIDRAYESQKKKYNIQQTCLKNISIVDFIENLFHEQKQSQSAGDSFIQDRQ